MAPDGVHGVVIQLARSDVAYPEPAELLRTTQRDTAAFPSSRGATDPTWWTAVWETEPGPRAVLGATHLGSTDLALSRALFEGVLGAEVEAQTEAQTEAQGERLECRWPRGAVVLHERETPGVSCLDLDGGPAGGLTIGSAALRRP